MAFKLKAPYNTSITPVYHVEEEDGVLGRANNNCTITVNNKIKDPKQMEEVISHEEVHIEQFKKFDKSNGKKGLNYNDKYVTWNGNKYPRKNGKIKYNGKWIIEGSKMFPWEKEAYSKENKQK
jgi:hypothetical protein